MCASTCNLYLSMIRRGSYVAQASRRLLTRTSMSSWPREVSVCLARPEILAILKSKTGLPNMRPCLWSHHTIDKLRVPGGLPYFKKSHVTHSITKMKYCNLLQCFKVLANQQVLILHHVSCSKWWQCQAIQRWRLKVHSKGFVILLIPMFARIVIYVFVIPEQVCV